MKNLAETMRYKTETTNQRLLFTTPELVELYKRVVAGIEKAAELGESILYYVVSTFPRKNEDGEELDPECKRNTAARDTLRILKCRLVREGFRIEDEGELNQGTWTYALAIRW